MAYRTSAPAEAISKLKRLFDASCKLSKVSNSTSIYLVGGSYMEMGGKETRCVLGSLYLVSPLTASTNDLPFGIFNSKMNL